MPHEYTHSGTRTSTTSTEIYDNGFRVLTLQYKIMFIGQIAYTVLITHNAATAGHKQVNDTYRSQRALILYEQCKRLKIVYALRSINTSLCSKPQARKYLSNFTFGNTIDEGMASYARSEL